MSGFGAIPAMGGGPPLETIFAATITSSGVVAREFVSRIHASPPQHDSIGLVHLAFVESTQEIGTVVRHFRIFATRSLGNHGSVLAHSSMVESIRSIRF